jgi:hypothetical protein
MLPRSACRTNQRRFLTHKFHLFELLIYSQVKPLQVPKSEGEREKTILDFIPIKPDNIVWRLSPSAWLIMNSIIKNRGRCLAIQPTKRIANWLGFQTGLPFIL